MDPTFPSVQQKAEALRAKINLAKSIHSEIQEIRFAFELGYFRLG
jgi:hypothetical protein